MDQTGVQSAQTVAALFDDQIDAEHALAALRKSSGVAANVSVLARDTRVDANEESALDVTRAVMDTALSTVSGWLIGLVALMVPQQGHYLAAGPIGVVLSKIRPEDVAASDRPPIDQGEPVGSVGLALERFGFREIEAHYLEQRVAAGSELIAVTASSRDEIDLTLKTFSNHNAVFIGQAETPGDVVAEAEQGLINPLIVNETEVVVADVVAPLRRACSGAHRIIPASQLAESDVFDAEGERIGDIDDVLVDPVDDAAIRYVIVGYGGVLGLARRRFAVPIDIVTIEDAAVRLGRERQALSEAPSFDSGVPFSRRDEESVHRFFGTKPYWLD